MTMNHIDQLAEWWSEAERAPFRKGDMLIARREDECVTYEVYPAGCDHNDPADNIRILSRAPKPKPAWHDAVAVIASMDNLTRQVWERDGDGWYGTDGYRVDAEALEEVSPLIEAKVTDEMVERARVHASARPINGDYLMRVFLTAALGLDPA